MLAGWKPEEEEEEGKEEEGELCRDVAVAARWLLAPFETAPSVGMHIAAWPAGTSAA